MLYCFYRIRIIFRGLEIHGTFRLLSCAWKLYFTLSESCPKRIVKIKFGVNHASSEIPKHSIGMGLKNYGSNRVPRKNLLCLSKHPLLTVGLFINKIKPMCSVQSYCQDFEGNHCASSHCPFHTPMEKNRNESSINNSRHREPRAHRLRYSQAAEL